MLVLALCATPSRALETLAYHFVREPDCGKPLAQFPALNRPPAANPFAAPGDTLRDLTPAVRATKVPLKDGWVVWNATRRLLVIRGAMADQWRISSRFGFHRQPTTHRVNVEWLRTPDSKRPPAAGDQPFAAVAALMPSEHKGGASTKMAAPDGEWKFSIEAEIQATEFGVTVLTLTADQESPSGQNNPSSGVCGSVCLLDGMPQMLASWHAAGRGDAWWLRVAATELLGDCTPWREARLRQVGTKSESWPTATPSFRHGTLPKIERPFVGTTRMPLDMIKNTLQPAVNDPLAGKPNQPGAPAADTPIKFPAADIPASLAAIATPPMLDLRQQFVAPRMDSDTRLQDGDFAAIEPESGRVVFASGNREAFATIRSLFVGFDDRPGFLRNIAYQTQLHDPADPANLLLHAALTSRTGARASLNLWTDNPEQPFIEVETALDPQVTPDGNESGISAQTACECRLKTAGGVAFTWTDNSTSRLDEGTPLPTEALRLQDGSPIRRTQTATTQQLIPE